MKRRKLVTQFDKLFENEEQIEAYLKENPNYEIAGYPNDSFMNSKNYSHISVIFNVYEEVDVPETKPMFGWR